MKAFYITWMFFVPLAVHAAHPICSEEDGVFKIIVAKEENLTLKGVERALEELSDFAKSEMNGEWDFVKVQSRLDYIRVYFEKIQVYKMAEENTHKEITSESREAYCRQIGKLPQPPGDDR